MCVLRVLGTLLFSSALLTFYNTTTTLPLGDENHSIFALLCSDGIAIRYNDFYEGIGRSTLTPTKIEHYTKKVQCLLGLDCKV